MRKSRCGLPPTKEVRRMVEYLTVVIYILFSGLLAMTTIAIALIIVLAIVLSNNENQ